MLADGLLVKLRNLDTRGIDRSSGLSDHLLKHVRRRQIVPWRRSITMIVWEEIVALPYRCAALRQQEAFVCLVATRLDVCVVEDTIHCPVVE